MASDLISRGALLEDLRESVNWLHKIYVDLKYEDEKRICSAEIATFTEVIMRVKDATAVDAVEVVRCKDCKHFDDGECTMLSEPKERREYERWVTIVDEDDFCSCGERRAEDAVD